jgi:hypothetical protein
MEEAADTFARLVLVENDLGVLELEDDGEELLGGHLPDHLFLTLLLFLPRLLLLRRSPPLT